MPQLQSQRATELASKSRSSSVMLWPRTRRPSGRTMSHSSSNAKIVSPAAVHSTPARRWLATVMAWSPWSVPRTVSPVVLL